MTGCSGDILKISKMTGAKQQLVLWKLLIGQKMSKTFKRDTVSTPLKNVMTLIDFVGENTM